MPFTDRELEKIATTDLERTLGFFPRVDTKASALFAVNSALLGLVCINFQMRDFRAWYLDALSALFVGLIVASLFFIYRTHFPHLKGGAQSLIYFGEIAKRTESNYICEMEGQDSSSRAKDLLGQVWRNAEILKIKFGSVRIAAILTAIALVPWCSFLVAASLVHTGGLVVK